MGWFILAKLKTDPCGIPTLCHYFALKLQLPAGTSDLHLNQPVLWQTIVLVSFSQGKMLRICTCEGSAKRTNSAYTHCLWSMQKGKSRRKGISGMGTCTTTHFTKDSVSGWVWDAESKLQLAVRLWVDGMIAQAAGQSAASATLKSCFSCREEDDIEITYSTHSKDLIIHLKRGSLLRFPTAAANLWDQAKANTDVEIIYRLFSLKAADPLAVPFTPGSGLLQPLLTPGHTPEKE